MKHHHRLRRRRPQQGLTLSQQLAQHLSQDDNGSNAEKIELLGREMFGDLWDDIDPPPEDKGAAQ